jgi:hypothetical protein
MEKINPPHLVAHLHFLQPHKSKQKNAKELPSKRTGDTANIDTWVLRTDRMAACNSTYKKLAVQCSADTFEVAESFVLRMNICGKNRQLLVAAKRYSK